MRALILGDLHLSDRPPSLRTETYAQDVLTKVEWVSKAAARLHCDVLIQAGDVFHIKSPSRTSHWLVQQAADALRAGGLPVLIVPGNHDMQHDRLDSLERQPLGALAKMRGIDLLVGRHPDLPVTGIPFLQFWTDLSTWLKAYDRSTLLVTHAPIMPPGTTVPYDVIPAEDWADMMGEGAVAYGHIHDNHGTYSVGDVLFSNQGALSRGSLHEATLKREPAVAVWDASDRTFTRVEVPHKSAVEVFRLSEKAVEDERTLRLDDFLESVESTSLKHLTVEEVLARLEMMSVPDETLKEVREIIEDVVSRT